MDVKRGFAAFNKKQETTTLTLKTAETLTPKNKTQNGKPKTGEPKRGNQKQGNQNGKTKTRTRKQEKQDR